MGTPNIKKTVNDLDAFQFQVIANTHNLLLHGKTPKYEDRFKSWARNTQGEHLENLTNAMLSAIAWSMATGKRTLTSPEVSEDFLRGQAQGILTMGEWIKTYASETAEVVDDEEDDVISGLG